MRRFACGFIGSLKTLSVLMMFTNLAELLHLLGQTFFKCSWLLLRLFKVCSRADLWLLFSFLRRNRHWIWQNSLGFSFHQSYICEDPSCFCPDSNFTGHVCSSGQSITGVLRAFCTSCHIKKTGFFNQDEGCTKNLDCRMFLLVKPVRLGLVNP